DVQGRQAESQAQIYQIDLEHADKVLSMQDDELEPTELKEVVELVTTAKLITEAVSAASATITAATTSITAATITAAPSSVRRRKKSVEVVTTAKLITEVVTAASAIIIGDAPTLTTAPKLNKNIDWDKVIDHVQRKQKEDNVVKRHQALKRKPQTEAQAKKNMMIYLRNVPVVDYEIHTENNKPYYKIKRVDGSHQLYLSILSMLRNFNREDFEVLWRLVKERF
nr:hypothetical protein [Tanacetum cinerariifolium]